MDAKTSRKTTQIKHRKKEGNANAGRYIVESHLLQSVTPMHSRSSLLFCLRRSPSSSTNCEKTSSTYAINSGACAAWGKTASELIARCSPSALRV